MAKQYKRSFVLSFPSVAVGGNAIDSFSALEKGVVVNGLLLAWSPSAAYVAGDAVQIQARALGTLPLRGAALTAAALSGGRDLLDGVVSLDATLGVFYLPLNHVNDGDEPFIGLVLNNSTNAANLVFSAFLDVFIPA